jgi:hypothetical protein
MRYEALTLHDPVFEADDPRVWRNECWNAGSTARLGNILDELKTDYVNLHFIGHPSKYGPLFLNEGPAEDYKVGLPYPLRMFPVGSPSSRNYARSCTAMGGLITLTERVAEMLCSAGMGRSRRNCSILSLKDSSNSIHDGRVYRNVNYLQIRADSMKP